MTERQKDMWSGILRITCFLVLVTGGWLLFRTSKTGEAVHPVNPELVRIFKGW